MKNWDGKPRQYAHIKRDGWSIRVVKDSLGLVKTFSSSGKELDLKFVPSLKNAWLRMPNDETVHGELYYPGRRASHVSSAIASQDVRLRFEIFGVESLEGGAPLELVRNWALLHGFYYVPWYPFNAQPPLDAITDSEGWVYTNGNMAGQKWKPEPTIDLICSGFIDGRGKNLGLVGSLVGSLEGRIVARVGGMDDKERAAISVDEDAYLGRVFEAAYQYVGDGKKLRHPRFIRWRDDKRPEDCLLSQDKDLL